MEGLYILYMKRDGKVTANMLAYEPETPKIFFFFYSKKRKEKTLLIQPEKARYLKLRATKKREPKRKKKTKLRFS